MAAVIQFGKLTNVVTPIKGTPFYEHWRQTVSPGVLTPVLTLNIPSSPGSPSWWVSTVYAAGRINAYVEVKRSGMLIFEGYIPVTGAPLSVSFPDGEMEAQPGQDLVVSLNHDHTAPLEFFGVLSGFKR